MKTEVQKAINEGVNLKTNICTTDRGVYTINIREHNNDIFFFKYLNGELVECMNLSRQVDYARRELGI